MRHNKTLKITIMAMMIALCYIGANFLKVDIPLPFGATKFHLGNTFCILAALMLGGTYGGLAGAIGMSLGDLFDPMYIASAPKTMILKFIIGFIAGSVAHKVFKITEDDTSNLKLKTFISAGCGAFANILIEPSISYLYYKFILGMSEKAAGAFASAKLITITTNAVLATIIAPILYFGVKSTFVDKNKFKELSK